MFLYIFWTFFSVLILMAAGLCYKIAKTDMRRRIIPDGYLFPLLIIGVIITTFFPWPTNIESGAIGMAFGYMLAAVVGLIFDKILTRKNPKAESPIGMGDIKLISAGIPRAGPDRAICAGCRIYFKCAGARRDIARSPCVGCGILWRNRARHRGCACICVRWAGIRRTVTHRGICGHAGNNPNDCTQNQNFIHLCFNSIKNPKMGQVLVGSVSVSVSVSVGAMRPISFFTVH